MVVKESDSPKDHSFPCRMGMGWAPAECISSYYHPDLTLNDLLQGPAELVFVSFQSLAFLRRLTAGLWQMWQGFCVQIRAWLLSHRHSVIVTFQIRRSLVSRANETDLRVSISTPEAMELPPFPKALLLQLCLGFNTCWALYKLRARHNKMWEKKCLS